MSRIGRMPIMLPPGISVEIKSNQVAINGPKGTLVRSFNPAMSIKLEDSKLIVTCPSDNRLYRALHGLTRSLLANMVEGVTKGFQKELEIVGVGYRAEKSGDKLILRVGQSYPSEVSPPSGISFGVEGTRIKVVGTDKELVGEITAKIRAIRPPDAYKGKGIRYAGEMVRLKPGKAGKVAKK